MSQVQFQAEVGAEQQTRSIKLFCRAPKTIASMSNTHDYGLLCLRNEQRCDLSMRQATVLLASTADRQWQTCWLFLVFCSSVAPKAPLMISTVPRVPKTVSCSCQMATPNMWAYTTCSIATRKSLKELELSLHLHLHGHGTQGCTQV